MCGVSQKGVLKSPTNSFGCDDRTSALSYNGPKNFNYQEIPSLTFQTTILEFFEINIGSIKFILQEIKCNFDLKCAAWPVAYFFLNGFVFVIKSNAGK